MEKGENQDKRAEPAEPSETEEQASAADNHDAATPDQLAEMRDRLLRLAAEFDNYKKRVAKEISEAKNFGKAELAAKLLPVLDEFELAMVNADLSTEHGKGMKIVFSNLLTALKQEGLSEIEGKGTYDPYLQEIMMARQSDKPEGEILDTVRKGYKWNGILIRPASVIVSKGQAAAEEEGKETKKKE